MIPFPDKKYDIIYTDPPWKQEKGNIRKCRPNQNKALDYQTLNIEEISQIHKHVFENICSDNHNVFMWTIDKFLPQTEKMMEELGYTLHCRFIWNKENGIAPAFTVRFSHEYLLWFYKKGKMLMPCKEQRGKFTTVFNEPSTKHSKKPQYAYEMIEAMFPNSEKLEMFARNKRNNWDSWGNEV